MTVLWRRVGIPKRTGSRKVGIGTGRSLREVALRWQGRFAFQHPVGMLIYIAPESVFMVSETLIHMDRNTQSGLAALKLLARQ